jgi:hypothetical protein
MTTRLTWYGHRRPRLYGERILANSPEKCDTFEMSDTPKTKLPVDEWPKTIRTREELDSALEAGEKSGASPYTIKEIAHRAIARLKADGSL